MGTRLKFLVMAFKAVTFPSLSFGLFASFCCWGFKFPLIHNSILLSTLSLVPISHLIWWSNSDLSTNTGLTSTSTWWDLLHFHLGCHPIMTLMWFIGMEAHCFVSRILSFAIQYVQLTYFQAVKGVCGVSISYMHFSHQGENEVLKVAECQRGHNSCRSLGEVAKFWGLPPV